jgi:hypothetical protein
MDLGDQFSLEHLLFRERKCRTCGEVKDLIEDYYVTRKSKRHLRSSYSYECRDCAVKRILSLRKESPKIQWEYPDW